MRLLWTRSPKIGSRLIRWGLGEKASHFAVVFDDRPGGYGLVFHSKFTGVGLEWWGHFQKHNEVVYQITPDTTLESEEALYQEILSRYYGSRYDTKALLYWAWRTILKKLFGWPIPPRNAWGDEGAYLCTELAEALTRSPFMPAELKAVTVSDYGMVTPQNLYNRMTVALGMYPA